MPFNAIPTEVVNQVLPVAELAELIYQCIISPPDFLNVESTENNLLTYCIGADGKHSAISN
ncbi:hypothetical protein H1P_720008 [Hyella patelloides LEGE 07179]|uniref:Uncharacterized protein n=1 Tax=Hyella patelloides LEGE 07179 TaxID=945734 RepID=A0A563W3J2_9CYAN|nr:hypothetical protein [Hyella patelloides]VEP18252.1 hypothetical protein H1P_720008 [Hyella patelloides LEGE 07179]